MKNSNYEILAPAGDFDSLKAGIMAGCNAVYLGGSNFGARAKAVNFTNEDLKKAVEYAHLRKVKIYVTVNTLLDDSELYDALTFANYLYTIGVDGIIVQDLGFGMLVRKFLSDFEVHGSTQMAINNLYGAKTVEDWGFSRVVLARETELDEISLIKENTNIEIEGFVHGALCVCFSGECLMSSMIGGRSGNRGECAQPCRKSYDILSMDKSVISKDKYFLSPRDLNTLLTVNDYISRGVYSLKIEGRMKKPQYVYQVVSSYKKAIEETLDSEDILNTEQIFNRGFTKGLFNGDFGVEFSSYDRPDNRGKLIGEVVDKRGSIYTLKLEEPIFKGDGIELYSKEGSFGFKSSEATEEKLYRVKLDRNIPVSSKVYRTYSKKLIENINESLNENEKYRKIKIKGFFIQGKEAKLIVESEGNKIEVLSKEVVEEAKKAPLSREKIVENISKLGDTVYSLETLNIICDENIFFPISSINSLRREAIEELNKVFTLVERVPYSIKKSDLNINREYREKKAALNIEVNSVEMLRELDFNYMDRVYVPIDLLDEKTLNYLNKRQIKISVVLKKFQNSKELERDFKTVKDNLNIVDEVLINNLSQVSIFKDINVDKVADIGLNVFNSQSVKYLLEMGFKRIILSPELNNSQIRKIAKNYGDVVEVLSHGLIPVMTLKYCPASVVKNCVDSSKCSTCSYEKGFYLRDKMGTDFLVERRKGVSEVFNSYPIVLLDKVKFLKRDGVVNFKLNVKEDLKLTTMSYYKALNEEDFNSDTLKDSLVSKYENITYGHYNRGIING